MENYKIERLELQFGEIPLVVFRPENFREKYKTIIHYHGWSSIVETYELFGRIFAHYGFQVILPEVVKHGVRGSADDYESYREMFDVVNQSIKEFDLIKEFAISELNSEEKDLIISGHSMGGIITSAIFARDLDLKSAIIFNSIINYNELKDNVEGSEDITDEMIEKIDVYNPMDKLMNFSGRDMLVLVGELDEVISPETMIRFQEILESEKVDSKNMIFSFHYDCAHSISYKMIEEALKYTLNLFEEV